MDSHELFGVLAGLVAAIGFIPYIWSMLKGRTKPNRASWLIWSVLGGCILASYHSSGATTTIWIAAIFTIMPIIIFLLSIKYGVGGYTHLDIVCLVGAAAGLLLWKLTNNPELALYLNIFVDSLGFLPTYKKAYLQPETENKLAWYMGFSATMLNLFAINSWQLNIALYPVYLVVFDAAVVILLLGVIQKRFKRVSL